MLNEEGVGSICHGYMCIVLYVKLMWCTGFPEIYAQLEERIGQLADLPNLNSFTFHALLHRRSFCITYERPNYTTTTTTYRYIYINCSILL